MAVGNAAVKDDADLQDAGVLQGAAPVVINSLWCKRCNICSALCPRCVLEPDREGMPVIARPRQCTQCGMCWLHCPDLAITSNVK